MLMADRVNPGETHLLPLWPRDGSGYHEGKIVYVHPRREFFTAEFTFPRGTVRESYCRHGKLAVWEPD